MKIVCTADLHGYLPEIPPCDLLIIAGDVCPLVNHRLARQHKWLIENFSPWLAAQPAKNVVGCWGNHDLIGESDRGVDKLLPLHILTDSAVGTEHGDLLIYGLPWSLDFFPDDWAFNLPADKLAEKYAAIPPCDILVSHGPAYGYGDRCDDGTRVGSPALVEAIDRVKPQLVVTGHIHEDGGRWQRGATTIINATYVNPRYRPHYPPYEIELASVRYRTDSPAGRG